MAFKWTPAADALLKAYAAEGQSAAYAAQLIGCDRSAAKYRASVLGQPFRSRAGRPAAPPKAKRKVKPGVSAPVPFLEATHHQCAWPMVARDEPGSMSMLVCGAPIAASARAPSGRVRHCYCERHHKRAHRRTLLQGFEAAFEGGEEMSL